MLEYKPVKGKTFSLFGSSDNTEDYYKVISRLADDLVKHNPDTKSLVRQIQMLSSIKRWLRNVGQEANSSSAVKKYYPILKSNLSPYTLNVKDHLRELSLWKKVWDKRLGTTEKQYHLYMLEIELVNRLYKKEFNKCEHKIALLPHCLRDLSRECKSAPDDFDYECKGCSKNCYVNEASKILRECNIHPYIWMSTDLKKLFKEYRSSNRSLGVLGIACIPELENGMKKCMKAGIPVVGLPLNANRCGRWFGEFYPNSINIHQLHNILE
ncbi:MAG: hypothetical protein A2V66_05425 [Ignavibacteria bacterium RBG_13_36_8]|nr:MAG: hypothetical protein A2V66_05425 [Ignavibacteria bacterium RBG_13_36_8]